MFFIYISFLFPLVGGLSFLYVLFYFFLWKLCILLNYFNVDTEIKKISPRLQDNCG